MTLRSNTIDSGQSISRKKQSLESLAPASTVLAPVHLDIANVYGFCNAGCDMCSLKGLKNKPRIMPNDVFETIIGKFCDRDIRGIKTLSLVGIGESLLDRDLGVKISCARSMGYKNVCVPTNAALLNEAKSGELLAAGLSEIVLGIDSIQAKVYEGIRANLSFETVMENAHRFIEMRDVGNFETKVYVRMIEQEENAQEIADYTAYWVKHLNTERGDMVLRFPRHNWADASLPIEKDCVCPYIFDRMVIDAWGDVQFCCIDVDSRFYALGNVLQDDPIELFNGDAFTEARRLMTQGKINDVASCQYCDVPLKRLDRGALL